MFAKGQKCRPFRLLGRGKVLPFRAAHGAKEDGIGPFAGFEGGCGQGFSVVVDGSPPNVGMAVFQGKTETFLGGIQNFDGFLHNFRADAVSGKDGNFFQGTFSLW